MAEVLTSKTLLFRIRDPGDGQAWGTFSQIYTPLVFYFCRKQGLGEADAADIVQDVMSSIARSITNFTYDPERGTFRSWLYTITRNRLAKHFRKSSQSPKAISQNAVTRLADEHETDSGTDALWESEYRQRLFQWAADSVRDEFQTQTWQAFWRTAVEHAPASDVAAELDMRLGAIYTARSRVTARLREKIASISGDLDDFLLQKS
ncbi:MAG: sigma-70 family RNA polymerase sigma factor [Verrucomicrobiota bacterium]